MKEEAWLKSIITAFENLGNEAEYESLYIEIKKIRAMHGLSLSKEWKATVRRVIEDHSSDSANFKSDDLFYKINTGRWGLRITKNSFDKKSI